MALIIPTCETAVSTLPEWHRAAFQGKEELVASSKGWSPGALNLAQGVAMKLHAQLLHNEMTQLLIDLSCDPADPSRWSSVSKTLTEAQREKLDQRQKAVYLDTLDRRISNAAHRNETAVHISFDTSPDLKDEWAVIEFDPRLGDEANFARRWQETIKRLLPEAIIRETSSPSRGLSAYLRGRHKGLLSLRFTAAQSSFLAGTPVPWSAMKKAVIQSVFELK